MFLSERIAQDQITIAAHMMGQTATHYQWGVTLFRPEYPGANEFTLPDPYESNDEPTAFDVLDLVTGACNIIDQALSWHDWQSEYMSAEPFTPEWEERDRTHAEVMYNQWCEINNSLRDFLGHQLHQDYLYDTDRSA